MSEITYICPFRKTIKTSGDCFKDEYKEEYFMPCDLEACQFCKIFEPSTGKILRCEYPNGVTGWVIKSEDNRQNSAK